MVRDFDGTDVETAPLLELCADALRAPTAGHSRAVELCVLPGHDGVRRYLDAATDPAWRERSTRAEGFARAGAAVLVVCDPAGYARRYAEADKAAAGLARAEDWPVPYWFGDAGAATMALLLLCEADGLAACFLGAFRGERDVLALVDAPASRRLYGAVLVGGGRRTAATGSLRRAGPTRQARVVVGRYGRESR